MRERRKFRMRVGAADRRRNETKPVNPSAPAPDDQRSLEQFAYSVGQYVCMQLKHVDVSGFPVQ